MKKIKDLIFKIIYFLVILYLLIFIPTSWGYKPLVVVSGSMEPKLKVGSILYYHKENIKNFDEKDILVFKNKGHIISHRIVHKNETGFITKGDANNSNDSNEIKNSQILGKGTNWCIPFLGYYANFVYTHKYLLFIGVLLLGFDFIKDYHHNRKKKRGILYEKNN